MKGRQFAFIILLFISWRSSGQSPENKLWFFISHTQKLAKKWDLLVDGQLRSANKAHRVETFLLRSALNYHLNDKHSVAAGYLNKGDWDDTAGKLNYQAEHRIYQQYLYSYNLKRTEFTTRFRLEQRFVREEEEAFKFSQRLRAFVSLQIPILANKDFSRGLYTALQNELFVNVQHKQNVNNHFFDQNRSYVSIGYRWSKKLDSEIGYYYWRQKEEDQTTNSNVVQLMLTTSF